MVDDGSGAKEIFRVDNFDLVQVPDEDHGKFYSGDCYVILYAYSTGTQDRFIIYFWLVSYAVYFSQRKNRDKREYFFEICHVCIYVLHRGKSQVKMKGVPLH